jgi:hypothetical protein
VAFFLRYIPVTNALIIRDSRWVPTKVIQRWCKNTEAAMITRIFFSSLADARSYQKKHGGRMYVCEFKSGRPAAEQDWRPITVK